MKFGREVSEEKGSKGGREIFGKLQVGKNGESTRRAGGTRGGNTGGGQRGEEPSEARRGAAVDKYSCLRFEYVLCKTTTFLKLSMSLLIFFLRFIPLYLNTTCKYLGQGESTCSWNRSNFLNIISLFTTTFQEAGGDTSTFNRSRYM